MCAKSLLLVSCLTLVTPWTVTHLAPLSMGFSRGEYWSGLTFPSPGDLPDPGIEPRSPTWQAHSLLLSHQGSPEEYVFLNCTGTQLTRCAPVGS